MTTRTTVSVSAWPAIIHTARGICTTSWTATTSRIEGIPRSLPRRFGPPGAVVCHPCDPKPAAAEAGRPGQLPPEVQAFGAAAFGGCADDFIAALPMELRASASLRCSLNGLPGG